MVVTSIVGGEGVSSAFARLFETMETSSDGTLTVITTPLPLPSPRFSLTTTPMVSSSLTYADRPVTGTLDARLVTSVTHHDQPAGVEYDRMYPLSLERLRAYVLCIFPIGSLVSRR